jgi:hypothetical protein
VDNSAIPLKSFSNLPKIQLISRWTNAVDNSGRFVDNFLESEITMLSTGFQHQFGDKFEMSDLAVLERGFFGLLAEGFLRLIPNNRLKLL